MGWPILAVGLTIFIAIAYYYHNLVEVQRHIKRKQSLEATMREYMESDVGIQEFAAELPPTMYVISLDEKDTVVEHTKNKDVVGLSTVEEFKNMGKTGVRGGYNHFTWINEWGKKEKHVGFCKRRNKQTIVLCQQIEKN